MISKAYVDTTVLTDALLKRRAPLGVAAEAALKRFQRTELPQYAIKEFKKGPLASFVYVHNKLVSTGSVTQTIAAIQKLSRTPQRHKSSTALEALVEAERAGSGKTAQQLVDEYGPAATQETIRFDQYRLALKMLIFKAWGRRHSVATATIQPLSCYKEAEPYLERGIIKLEPKKCAPPFECCLGPTLRKEQPALRSLVAAIEKEPSKLENVRRLSAIKSILAGKPATDKICNDLGDAVFVLFAPTDSTILTTNIRDFKPLADAVGKAVGMVTRP